MSMPCSRMQRANLTAAARASWALGRPPSAPSPSESFSPHAARPNAAALAQSAATSVVRWLLMAAIKPAAAESLLNAGYELAMSWLTLERLRR